MSLDTTAERANEPGWSREALKAAKAKKKADKKIKAKADRRAFFGKVRRVIADIWDFILRNMLLTLALGASIATAAWEWFNSARGWRDLYPGIPVFWTYVGAAGAVALWYIAFRKTREEAREPEATRSGVEIGGWFLAAVCAFVVCVAGVFVATATNSVEAQRAAKESRREYIGLVAKRDSLKEQVDLYGPDYWQQMIIQDQRTMDAQVNIAKGTFGMADLEVDGGCAAQKLSFNQRRLCARVNGGVDEFSGEAVIGIRNEIARSERQLGIAEQNVADLAALQLQVASYRVLSGDETAEAMGSMFGDVMKGDSIMGWVLLALSTIFLLASGWAADWAMESIERKRIAGRKKAGRP